MLTRVQMHDLDVKSIIPLSLSELMVECGNVPKRFVDEIEYFPFARGDGRPLQLINGEPSRPYISHEFSDSVKEFIDSGHIRKVTLPYNSSSAVILARYITEENTIRASWRDIFMTVYGSDLGEYISFPELLAADLIPVMYTNEAYAEKREGTIDQLLAAGVQGDQIEILKTICRIAPRYSDVRRDSL